MLHLGLEKKLFVSCNCPKKYKVCRSVFSFFFFALFLFDWETERQNIFLRDFL